MNKVFLILMFFATSFCLHAQQDSITIKGKLKGLGNAKVWIVLAGPGGKLMGSVINATNDAFSVNVPRQEMPMPARLNIGVNRSLSRAEGGKNYSLPAPLLDLIIYQSNLTVKGTVENMHRASVQGDIENVAYTKLRNSCPNEWALQKKIFSMDAQSDSVQYNRLKEEHSKAYNITADKQLAFIKNNPDKFLSIVLLSRMKNYYTTASYETTYNGFADTYKQTASAKQIAALIARMQPTAVGKPAINFIRKDKDGNEVNLENYKGKLVLLDFWGSWCGPCRATHPHLKELYTRYKNKGFEIIAVAHERGATLEQSRKNWLTAIDKDNINWVHILNQEGIEKQDIVRAYNIEGFPTKILLDKEGKILLRVTSSANDDLDKLLEKLL